MSRFHGHFRIDSTRLKNWDYSTSGWYFVTVCTKDQVPFFGEILQEEVALSSVGEMAYRMWEEIPCHHSAVGLDEFIIMPNHIHGVIVLYPKKKGSSHRKSVETLHARSVRPWVGEGMAEISPRKGSLSVIVRSYKSALTRWARQNGYERFAWHPRYYDHIIRNEEDLRRIRRYIRENPLKWELDRYYRADPS